MLLFISIGFVLLYILPLGIRPIAIPDEVRYAEIPREMISSGDWIVPRLNGLLYFEKPVMGYWLNGLAIKAFGENAFSIRLTSAVSTGLSALMVFLLTVTSFKSTRKAILAVSVFLTFFLVYGLGVFSALDGMFSFFLTGCIGFFFLFWSAKARAGGGGAEIRSGIDSSSSRYLYLVLTGIFCGFAFLTKGFLAFAVPVSVIIPFLIWEKDFKTIFQAWMIPFLAALIVILPWAILIHINEPDYWHFFFWHEHIKRFFSQNAQHKESFFFFFMVLPATLFPWTFLVPAALNGLGKKCLSTPLLKYALCWFIFPFLLFSFSSGKLSTYILPCFPALGILLSSGLVEYLNNKKSRLFNNGLVFSMIFIGLLILVLIILQTRIIEVLHPFAYTIPGKGYLFVAVLIIFILILKLSLSSEDDTKKILLVAAAPLCFYFCTHFLVPDLTLLRKCPGELIDRNRHRIDSNTLVFSPSTPVRAVNWFLKRADVTMLGRGELAYGLEQSDAKGRLVTYEQFYEMLKNETRTRKIALIIDHQDFENIKKHMPEPLYMDTSGYQGFTFLIF